MYRSRMTATCPHCYRQFGLIYDKDASTADIESVRSALAQEVSGCDHQQHA